MTCALWVGASQINFSRIALPLFLLEKQFLLEKHFRTANILPSSQRYEDLRNDNSGRLLINIIYGVFHMVSYSRTQFYIRTTHSYVQQKKNFRQERFTIDLTMSNKVWSYIYTIRMVQHLDASVAIAIVEQFHIASHGYNFFVKSPVDSTRNYLCDYK